LPKVKKCTLQAYVVWINSGKVSNNKSTTYDFKQIAQEKFREIVELYLLGGFLDGLPLRNTAMRTLVTNFKNWGVQPSIDVINQVWDSTAPGSHLRQMIVDETIMRLDRNGVTDELMADYPKDMLHNIARTLLRKSAHVSFGVFASGLEEYLEPEASNEVEKSK
jgi:hypothetical protein